MKKYAIFLIIVLATMAMGIAAQTSIPDSLRKYYPPYSHNYEFYNNMRNQEIALMSLKDGIDRGDWATIEKWSLSLSFLNQRANAMVPEWKDYERDRTYVELLKIINSNNSANRGIGQVSTLYNAVVVSCDSCHTVNLANTKRVFYSNFVDRNTTILSNYNKQVYTYKSYMDFVNSNLKGMVVASLNNNWRSSAQKFNAFFSSYEQLEETCASCHSDQASIDRFFGKSYLRQKARIQLDISKRLSDNLSYDVRSFEDNYCQSCHNTHRWTDPALFDKK